MRGPNATGQAPLTPEQQAVAAEWAKFALKWAVTAGRKYWWLQEEMRTAALMALLYAAAHYDGRRGEMGFKGFLSMCLRGHLTKVFRADDTGKRHAGEPPVPLDSTPEPWESGEAWGGGELADKLLGLFTPDEAEILWRHGVDGVTVYELAKESGVYRTRFDTLKKRAAKVLAAAE